MSRSRSVLPRSLLDSSGDVRRSRRLAQAPAVVHALGEVDEDLVRSRTAVCFRSATSRSTCLRRPMTRADSAMPLHGSVSGCSPVASESSGGPRRAIVQANVFETRRGHECCPERCSEAATPPLARVHRTRVTSRRAMFGERNASSRSSASHASGRHGGGGFCSRATDVAARHGCAMTTEGREVDSAG